MAKFKMNHTRESAGKSTGTMVKVGLFGAIITALFFFFNKFTGGGNNEAAIPKEEVADTYTNEFYLPTASGQVVKHRFYSLSYVEAHEQAEWVAYTLTRDNLKKGWVERQDNFLPDPKVRTESATPNDYRNSGYDRGHLVPAADMAFDEDAMMETFFMSNISPQAKNFNKGIWRELEELTRSWAEKNVKLFVVTGPILTGAVKGKIGANEVSIPTAFYKVLLDLNEPEKKAIAFVVPNEISYEPLYKYVKSVDEVEQLTGIDFFPELMPKEMEQELEARYNLDLWEFNKKKFETRTQKWNVQE
ncbi:MAG: DNA/RNA non-specific endonuclease [Saprospiraceae bacterium]|nr:DNA/RNA non-specific endonuclease [Saprospiraceae bacterium]MDZ4704625.1 DNA/RNA non-specific endonuclease [Saprospiraceae bacterium]